MTRVKYALEARGFLQKDPPSSDRNLRIITRGLSFRVRCFIRADILCGATRARIFEAPVITVYINSYIIQCIIQCNGMVNHGASRHHATLM